MTIESGKAPVVKFETANARELERANVAAAHRLAVLNDFHESIDNHITALVPGSPSSFYLMPYGLHWSEVTASSLLEVSLGGDIIAGEGIAEPSAINIHAPLHRHLKHAHCVIHTHMPYMTAISQLEDMTIEMTGQAALMFENKIAYDYEYNGFADEQNEGDRMAAIMGDKPVLVLGNHGVIVCGETVAQAFHRLYFLERAARTQLFSMWTGQRRKWVQGAVTSKMRAQAEAWQVKVQQSESELHFTALKRLLEKSQPDYRY